MRSHPQSDSASIGREGLESFSSPSPVILLLLIPYHLCLLYFWASKNSLIPLSASSHCLVSICLYICFYLRSVSVSMCNLISLSSLLYSGEQKKISSQLFSFPSCLCHRSITVLSSPPSSFPSSPFSPPSGSQTSVALRWVDTTSWVSSTIFFALPPPPPAG